MKNETPHSNKSVFFEQVRQQAGSFPMNGSFPANPVAKKPDSRCTLFTYQPAMMQPVTGNCNVANLTLEESSFLQAMAGIVRSFVFFDWKDHA